MVRWLASLISGAAVLVGALLIGWNSLEVYYLVTGRIRPDLDQPPLTVVVSMLILGLALLICGYSIRRWLRKETAL